MHAYTYRKEDRLWVYLLLINVLMQCHTMVVYTDAHWDWASSVDCIEMPEYSVYVKFQ